MFVSQNRAIANHKVVYEIGRENKEKLLVLHVYLQYKGLRPLY